MFTQNQMHPYLPVFNLLLPVKEHLQTIPFLVNFFEKNFQRAVHNDETDLSPMKELLACKQHHMTTESQVIIVTCCEARQPAF